MKNHSFRNRCKAFPLLVTLTCATTAWAQTTVTTDKELRTAIGTDGADISVTADIDLSNSTLSIASGTTVTIDLGGHTLDRKLTKRGEGGGQVITVRKGATLNLSNGTLKGGWGGDSGGINNEGGTVNLTDVTITGCTGDDRGGGIVNRSGGKLTMTGGAITGNTSNDRTTPEGGGGVFNFEGATMTLTGVTITGNEAKVKGGGGLCNYGTMTLDGCTITGNSCQLNGGGIWTAASATLKMQGKMTVTGNTTTNGVTNNVFLKTNAVITVTGSLAGSSVGVNMEAAGIFTSGYNTNNSGIDPTTLFAADLYPSIEVSANGNEVCLAQPTESTVYYIERSWDEVNKKVVSTVRNLASGEYSTISSRKGDLTIAKDGFYVVKGNVEINGEVYVTADNCSIVLCDGASLTVDDDMIMKGGNTLNIYGQRRDSGVLTVDGKNGNDKPALGTMSDAGQTLNFFGGTVKTYGYMDETSIGGYKNFGSINIYGGDITANTDGTTYGQDIKSSPGIGGSFYLAGGSIHIYGGTVKALTDGEGAAAIGTGNVRENDDNIPASSLSITIDGGNVVASANGGYYGAGIGGGKRGRNPSITINGGYVEATGSDHGVGIGGAYNPSSASGPGSQITITGGHVIARGGGYASGIGGGIFGYAFASGSVTISNAYVEAYGGNDAAGIGGSESCNGADVTIYSGTVIARGGEYAAGIGGGDERPGGTIIIYDGHVEAYGGVDAAGIGGGEGGEGGTVTINGGYVYAEGNDYGAGIGGGEDGAGGKVTITDGEIFAKGGKRAVAIGPGNGSNNNGTLDIGNTLQVRPQFGEGWFAPVAADKRVNNCRNNQGVWIKPCNHDNATYTVSGTTSNDTHTKQCQYCTTPFVAEKHTFDNGTCTVCGVMRSTAQTDLTLTDGAANGETLVHYNGEQVESVTLSGRTLMKNNLWNTLCLPFALSAEQLAASPLSGCTLKELDVDGTYDTDKQTGFDEATGTLNLYFKTATSIEAGKTYLIKWSSGTNIENPLFTNVTIANVQHDVTSADGKVSFNGIYSPKAIAGEDKSMLYLGSGNKLYYPDAAMTINAFRGYFSLNGITAGDVAKARMLFGDENTTGIRSIDDGQCIMDHCYYTIDGIQLKTKPTAKGVYIYNGRIIMIK